MLIFVGSIKFLELKFEDFLLTFKLNARKNALSYLQKFNKIQTRLQKFEQYSNNLKMQSQYSIDLKMQSNIQASP